MDCGAPDSREGGWGGSGLELPAGRAVILDFNAAKGGFIFLK